MQVHAVPDSERVIDSTGRRLPWGYEFAETDHGQRRMPEEKGPFGKARKRGTSRSKTMTPAREDKAKIDNLRVIDNIFSKHKSDEENQQKESLRSRKASVPSSSLPLSASTPNLIDAGGLGNSTFQGSAPIVGVKEPTEVILWGYNKDVQWAAIEFYEKVSGGIIYEEYERQPPNARYNLALSHQKAALARSLNKLSLRRINEYVGGEHWIKVTFDSPEAAERACHYSPHVIQGFQVSAQRYTGRKPEDVAVRAGAGSRLTSQTGSPNTMSSTTMPFSTSSATLSSATATNSMPASMPPRMASEPSFRASGAFPYEDDEPTLMPRQQRQAQPPATATTTSVQTQRQPGRSTLRVKGAKPAVLLPPEKAFLPAASRWQQTFGSWPIIGWVIGSNHGIIGDQVPRKEDGSFDSANAGLYWRLWYSVDSCFGTDFCGLRDLDNDD